MESGIINPDLGSTIWDPESMGWDLEFEGHLDSFTQGDYVDEDKALF